MIASYETDLNTGSSNEKEMLSILRKHFNKNINQTKYRYTKYDFYDTESIYELKTRNTSYKTFNTTLIPQDKIFTNIKKNQYFIFSFLDKIGYIKYDNNVFKNFLVKEFVRKSREGIKDIKKNYVYIPIHLLTTIEHESKPQRNRCMINIDDIL